MVTRFDILTIFPEPIQAYLASSLLGKASQRGLVNFNVHQLRDWAKDKHRMVDDATYGGGEGMVFKPEPLITAIEELRQVKTKSRVVYLSPQGKIFNQNLAKKLLGEDQLILLCGRYEGVDERVLDGWVDEEISLGDFVMCGGEIAALAVVETVVRLIPGVVGNEQSLVNESFSHGLLEYPHYTRPQNFRGKKVPEILLSGHHGEIEIWRRQEALRRTYCKRPELLKNCQLTESDRRYLAKLEGHQLYPLKQTT